MIRGGRRGGHRGAGHADRLAVYGRARVRWQEDTLRRGAGRARRQRKLERTGADVGSTKKLYADAQTLQFCSAKLSRKTMEAYAGNVVMCPYSIVVYATAARPDEVFVAYRRLMSPGGGPASRRALGEVEALLDAIAKEAVGRK